MNENDSIIPSTGSLGTCIADIETKNNCRVKNVGFTEFTMTMKPGDTLTQDKLEALTGVMGEAGRQFCAKVGTGNFKDVSLTVRKVSFELE